jgi:hypothetical protein
MKKSIVFLSGISLFGSLGLQAAEYIKLDTNEAASIQVNYLTIIDSVGNHFVNTGLLKATDTKPLYVGQKYSVSNLTKTSPGTEDGIYGTVDKILVIPELIQNHLPSYNVTLSLTNNEPAELTVTGLGIFGPQGSTGATGPQGLKGDTGAKGDIGPKGDAGAKGDVGPKGAAGLSGFDGQQGPKGDTGLNGTNGQGVPIGGSSGQILTKINSTDFNTTWANPSDIVKDGAGNILGKLNTITLADVTIYRSGYTMQVIYDGYFWGSDIYWSGTNCTGTPYLSYNVVSTKYLFFNPNSNKIYKVAAPGGVAYGVNTAVQSVGHGNWSSPGSYQNTCEASNFSQKLVEAVAIDVPTVLGWNVTGNPLHLTSTPLQLP